MPRLTVKEGAIAAAVGAVDMVIENNDRPIGPTSASELYKVAAAVGGGLGSLYLRNPRYADVLGTVSIASIPMLERVLWSRIKGVKKTARFMPRMSQTQIVSPPRGLALEESPSLF